MTRETLAEILKDNVFFDQSGEGSLSGGEPLRSLCSWKISTRKDADYLRRWIPAGFPMMILRESSPLLTSFYDLKIT